MRARIGPASIGLLAAALLVAAFALLLERRAAPHLLLPEHGVQWLLLPGPAALQASAPRPVTVIFRTTLQHASDSAAARAALATLGDPQLSINGRSVAPARAQRGPGEYAQAWFDLGPQLDPGPNQVVVAVTRAWGPPAMRMTVELAGLAGLAGGDGWQASLDGVRWRPVRRADERAVRPDELTRWQALAGIAERIPALLAFAAAGAALAWGLGRWGLGRWAAGRWHPGRARNAPAVAVRAWRWVLVGGLAGLFAWNVGRLPGFMGMDIQGHTQYVNYILARAALPYANEGWQLFQPPLAYLAAAVAELARARWAPGLQAIEVIRALAMLCGVAAAAFTCRSCSLAFARTPAAAAFAMVVAAFLPAGLYIAQAFGNEAFAGLFGALLVFEVAALYAGDTAPVTRARALRIGLWAGLGLLAKATVLLMLPGVGIALALRAWRHAGVGAGARAALARTTQAAVVCIAVAGWWYARNVLHFGRPFVGGWEPGRGFDWWQYPGYRIPQHLLRFGEALSRPYYSGLDSFWDAIHASLWLDGGLSGMLRPDLVPWNHGAMAALSLLSLPMAAAIICGALRALLPGDSSAERALALFSAATVGVLLAAMLLIYAQVPAYSPAKGSYLVPAAGCLAILAGYGVAPLLERAWGRVAAAAYAAVWLGFVVMAFAVR